MPEATLANPSRYVIRMGPRVGRAVPNAAAPGALLIDVGVEQFAFEPNFAFRVRRDGRVHLRQANGRRVTIRLCVEGDPEWAVRTGALTLPGGGGVFFGPGIAAVLSLRRLRRFLELRRLRTMEARRLLRTLGRE